MVNRRLPPVNIVNRRPEVPTPNPNKDTEDEVKVLVEFLGEQLIKVIFTTHFYEFGGIGDQIFERHFFGGSPWKKIAKKGKNIK